MEIGRSWDGRRSIRRVSRLGWRRNVAVCLGAASLAAAPFPIAPPAAARPAWISGTFVYGDLCASGAGAAGRRVTLRRSPNGDAVIYEAAHGTRAPSVRGEALRFDDAVRAVAFSASTDAGPVVFEGIAGPGALTGTLRDAEGERVVHLPRVLRVRSPDCGPAVEAVGR